MQNLDIVARNIDYSKMTLNGYTVEELEQLKAQQPVKCEECVNRLICFKSINGRDIFGRWTGIITFCSHGKRKGE